MIQIFFLKCEGIVKNIVEGPSQNLLESVARPIATTTLYNHFQTSVVRVVV